MITTPLFSFEILLASYFIKINPTLSCKKKGLEIISRHRIYHRASTKSKKDVTNIYTITNQISSEEALLVNLQECQLECSGSDQLFKQYVTKQRVECIIMLINLENLQPDFQIYLVIEMQNRIICTINICIQLSARKKQQINKFIQI
ncbi:hypothetical protein TTHERM_00348460 (macronuclear) [Tetrahymena thermophila SB210]|uniref:Uncharacterized protein n=1 Tax=Tetrahymena thermophila (strain SB210) TaxID=312017 RepID=I7MHA6_TETTS|nr:hypothetical protein TTHERM_00348460 [Tetrahymena thermophila SB210]EAS02756.1 hypothetical protein TTHERM_00348460 [Tetrahymena thermophila SB210]|eukprot:XP_001023001.1 hypothetical protein TTHERM_00348460 [Tetrahymena thermophila SB210]